MHFSHIFNHPLEDCIQWAHALQLWKRTGYQDIKVAARPESRLIWNIAGVQFVDLAEGRNPDYLEHTYDNERLYFSFECPLNIRNKVLENLVHPAVPYIGKPEDLWDDLAAIRLSAEGHIPAVSQHVAHYLIDGLPKPVVAVNLSSTSVGACLSVDFKYKLIKALLANNYGVVVFAHTSDEICITHSNCRCFQRSDLEDVLAVLDYVDLLISVPSWVLHLATLLPIKSINLACGIEPWYEMLPNDNIVHYIPYQLNELAVIHEKYWRLVDYFGNEPSVDGVLAIADGLLNNDSSRIFLSKRTISSDYAGEYYYTRLGYDTRKLELLASGNVGYGGGQCEKFWYVREFVDAPVLFVEGDCLTFYCIKHSDGVWRGKWLVYERMPVELAPCKLREPAPDDLFPNYRGIYVYNNARYIVDLIIVNDNYKLLHIPMPQQLNVIDVGANVGAFSVAIYRRQPSAKIACVELNPDLWEVLDKNVGKFAKVYHAALWYGKETIRFYNPILAGQSPGLGIVVSDDKKWLPSGISQTRVANDPRQIPTITLEQIADECNMDVVTILKMDCEQCECNAIENAYDWLEKHVAMIILEVHGLNYWHKFAADEFAAWRKRTIRTSYSRYGNFEGILLNPRLAPTYFPLLFNEFSAGAY